MVDDCEQRMEMGKKMRKEGLGSTREGGGRPASMERMERIGDWPWAVEVGSKLGAAMAERWWLLGEEEGGREGKRRNGGRHGGWWRKRRRQPWQTTGRAAASGDDGSSGRRHGGISGSDNGDGARRLASDDGWSTTAGGVEDGGCGWSGQRGGSSGRRWWAARAAEVIQLGEEEGGAWRWRPWRAGGDEQWVSTMGGDGGWHGGSRTWLTMGMDLEWKGGNGDAARWRGNGLGRWRSWWSAEVAHGS